MIRQFDPERDLTLTRIIKAPRAAIWSAWTNPRSFEQWWIPAPARCKVTAMDLRPGGAFAWQISEDGGDFVPHGNACFLAVDENERIVFTDALLGGWRPSGKPFITAIITLKDHRDGTAYEAYVMHQDKAVRDRHEEMGFYDGWGTVVGQLAKLVERR